MCAGGNPISAEEALRFGIIDRIIEGDLQAGAVRFAREIVARPAPKTRDLDGKLETPQPMTAIFTAARETARIKQRGMMAPLAAIDAVEAATKMSFEDGCRIEAAALYRMPAFGTIQSADSCFLWRARGCQNPGCAEGDTDNPREQCCGRWRWHHGRRHRHGVRQCRHSRAAERSRSTGTGPRPGQYSEELRKLGEARPLHPTVCRRTAEADSPDASIRRIRESGHGRRSCFRRHGAQETGLLPSSIAFASRAQSWRAIHRH